MSPVIFPVRSGFTITGQYLFIECHNRIRVDDSPEKWRMGVFRTGGETQGSWGNDSGTEGQIELTCHLHYKRD